VTLSTVLHLIAGLVIPDCGEILIDGELVATAHRNLREPEQRGIGMVFQDLALWPHMTVAENLEFGLRAKRIPNEQRAQRVSEMVALVRLGDYLNARPAELSGGQQQRLVIARVLAVDPQVILMDEPASALDPISTAKLEDLIHQLKSNYTIVIVTHNMQQAARVSDFTGFFLNGEMIEYDVTNAIFTAPRIKRTEDYITGRFG
jgi:ABC-type phosphate transport system ATPase subunit